MIISFG